MIEIIEFAFNYARQMSSTTTQNIENEIWKIDGRSLECLKLRREKNLTGEDEEEKVNLEPESWVNQ